MSEDVRKRIGAMLRALREERGFSLGHVQHLTHDIDWPISRSRLSQLERGEVEVHLSDLYPLSRTYGFSIGSLISEAIIAHSKKKFAKGLTADELFEQAKELFRIGKPLEAAWTFDEAGRRAEDGKTDFRHLCMISAGHCYERLDAYDLALKRVQSVLDTVERDTPDEARALGKACRLLAITGSTGRARIYLDRLRDVMSQRQKSDLRAYLEGVLAETLAVLGEFGEAARLAKSSSRRYSKLGNFDMAAKLGAASARYESHCANASPVKAERIARDAYSMLREDSDSETRSRVAVTFGECLLRVGKSEEASSVTKPALDLAKAQGDTSLLQRALKVLARASDELGDSRGSSRWRERLKAIESQIESAVATRRQIDRGGLQP